jgi:ubiquinone/menaquinone biosynthesis C-methylase UbiE
MTMKELNKHEEAVAQHYHSVAFEYEQQRLATSASVEFAVTVRYLERYLPVSARVAELGVGSGQYTEVLAQKPTDCATTNQIRIDSDRMSMYATRKDTDGGASHDERTPAPSVRASL